MVWHWGVIAGALMHCLIQLPALLKLPEQKYSLTLGLKMPEVREVAQINGTACFGGSFCSVELPC